MKSRIQILCQLLAVLISGITTAQSSVSLGQGTAKISLGDMALLLNGVKLYPGDQVTLSASGQVRRNWEQKTEESCFLWFCDEETITYHNYRSPANLPVTIHIVADDGTRINPDGFLLGASPLTISIPEQLPFTKSFAVYARFEDPGIDHNKSDGEYVVNASAKYNRRLELFKNYLTQKGSDLSYEMISSKDVVGDLFAKTYPQEIALALADHLNRFPQVEKEDKRLILDFMYKLDPSNPRVSLALAKNALSTYDLTGAETAIINAKNLITQNGGDNELLGEAYGLLGQFYEIHHEGSMQQASLEEASSFYGSAADHYLKALNYDSAIQAYYNQGRVLRRLGFTASLEKSLEVLKQADAISNRQYVVRKNNTYGFINNVGEISVQPQFDSISPSKNYIRPAKKNGRWGYIDILGRTVLDFQYDAIGPLREGIAWVKSGDTYYYIDVKGKKITNSQYKWASSFLNHFAFVLDENDEYYFINRSGEKFARIPQQYIAGKLCGSCSVDEQAKKLVKNQLAEQSVLYEFSYRFNFGALQPYNKTGEPYAPLGTQPQDNNFGFIQQDGTIRQYPDGSIIGVAFNKNSFYVLLKNNTVVLKDLSLNGRSITPPITANYWIIPLGNGGLAWGYQADMVRRGFINDQLTKKTEPIFQWMYSLDNQLTIAGNENLYRVIRNDGSSMIERPIENSIINAHSCCIPFLPLQLVPMPLAAKSETPVNDPFPYLSVRYGEQNTNALKKAMLISKVDGAEIIPSGDYDDFIIFDPDENIFLTYKMTPRLELNAPIESKIGLYKPGKGQIAACIYDTIKPSPRKDLAIMCTQKKQGVLNIKTGQVKIAPSYELLNFFNDTLLIASQNGKSGIIDNNNKEVLPFKYDEITYMSPGDEMAINLPEEFSESPLHPFPAPYRPSELYAKVTVGGKTGVVRIADMVEVVKPQYDYVALLRDKFLAVTIRYGADQKEYYKFQLFTLFQTVFYDETFLYLRYDPTDKVYLGITNQKKLTLFNNRGDRILSADITIQDGDITDEIDSGRYSISNISVKQFDGSFSKIPGMYSQLIKLPGKISLSSSNQVIQINIEKGSVKQIDANKIMLSRF